MLEIRGEGGLRKSRGTWQATFSVLDTESGERTTVTRMTGVPCSDAGNRGARLARERRAELRAELADELRGRSSLSDYRRPDTVPDPVLAEALTDYIDYKYRKGDINKNTAAVYRRFTKRLRADLGGVHVHSLTSRDVVGWAQRSLAEGHGKTALDRALVVLKCYYRELMALEPEGSSFRNPMDRVSFHMAHRTTPNSLTRESIAVLSRAIEADARSRTLRAAALALHTGMRVGEVCARTWGDIDQKSRIIRIATSATRYAGESGVFIKDTKSHRPRLAPIDDTLLSLLGTWLESDFELVHGRPPRGQRELRRFRDSLSAQSIITAPGTGFWAPNAASCAFTKLAARLGLKGTERKLRFHSLRHTYATQWVAAGGDVRTLSSVMGHADASMTLNVYASVDERAMARGASLADAALSAVEEADPEPVPALSDGPGEESAAAPGTGVPPAPEGVAAQVARLTELMGVDAAALTELALREFISRLGACIEAPREAAEPRG